MRSAKKIAAVVAPGVDSLLLDLTEDGIPCIPVIGRNDFSTVQKALGMHTHPGCLEIIYCRKGELEYESGRHTYQLRPGHVFTSLPDQPHRLVARPKGLSTYYLYMRIPKPRADFLGLPPRDARWLRGSLLTLPRRLFAASKSIPRLFREVFRFCDSLPPRSPERTFRLRLAIASLLLETVLSARNDGKSVVNDKVQSVIDEMRESPERQYPLDKLIARTFLSPSVLMSTFKRLTGLPPHAFLISCRISRAKRDLAAGDASVSSIASHLGFPSGQHFATLFKSETGMTPLAWREAARTGE